MDHLGADWGGRQEAQWPDLISFRRFHQLWNSCHSLSCTALQAPWSSSIASASSRFTPSDRRADSRRDDRETCCEAVRCLHEAAGSGPGTLWRLLAATREQEAVLRIPSACEGCLQGAILGGLEERYLLQTIIIINSASRSRNKELFDDLLSLWSLLIHDQSIF